MTRYVLRRLAWMVPTLFGITLLTFVVLDVGPLDRAELAAAGTGAPQAGAESDSAADRRAESVRRLRLRYGMIDADGNEKSVWSRYVRWVGHAARFDFAGPGDDAVTFRARFGRALTVTILLGVVSGALALVGGVLLGWWLGCRHGRRRDRWLSGAMLTAYALPEFVIGSLLLLFLCGGIGAGWLPSGGLRDPESGDWSALAQLADLGVHLLLPVLTLTLAPLVVVARLVREATARALESEFVTAMRNWGMAERDVQRAARRHGLRPVATTLGTLVPAMLAGSVVVEQLFGLPGVGRLAYAGVLSKDVGVVMALTLLVSILTLLAMLVSDLLHRWLDPRVELR